MKERPILFGGAMVRALLDGGKTQTRRVVRKQFGSGAIPAEVPATSSEGWQITGHSGRWWDDVDGCDADAVNCPFGVPGDHLWVRETWTWIGGMIDCKHPRRDELVYDELYVRYVADDRSEVIRPGRFVKTPEQPPQCEGEVYSLRDAPDSFKYTGENTYTDRLHRWWQRKIPAIHMPRWASRITLEVTGVRVERLQDISETDAIAEGIRQHDGRNGWVNECTLPDGKRHFDASAYGMYRQLWDSLNAARGYGWDFNPWVWVVEFKRTET